MFPPFHDIRHFILSIGLNTILIVHQRCGLDNCNGGHNSLSESTEDPYRIIQTGYINALEYQKPNVEGIIKNCLQKIDTNIALITGSDCHDWECYPNHDKDSPINDKYFSKCKILPSFKGLLLGLTSPKTRFNRQYRINNNYISSFSINGKVIPLDPGINVIIGENGSGKSTLFDIMSNSNLRPYVKDLKHKNEIGVNSSNLQLRVIHQAEIISQFQDNKLFSSDELFNTIDDSDFEIKYSDFSIKLKDMIEGNIQRNKAISSLEKINFEIKDDCEEISTHFIAVLSDSDNKFDNSHAEHKKNISKILKMLFAEYDSGYYSKEEKKNNSEFY